MAFALVWLAAYLIAGHLYVRRDLNQPPWNRPGYAVSKSGRMAVRLLWPLVTGRMLLVLWRLGGGRSVRKYLRREVVPTWLTFLVIGAGGSLALG